MRVLQHAILAADCIGLGKLAGADRSGAMARLRLTQQIEQGGSHDMQFVRSLGVGRAQPDVTPPVHSHGGQCVDADILAPDRLVHAATAEANAAGGVIGHADLDPARRTHGMQRGKLVGKATGGEGPGDACGGDGGRGVGFVRGLHGDSERDWADAVPVKRPPA